MFIDVLRIPSITQAVEEASRLLRVGIIRAMQSNPGAESDSETAKQARNHKASTPATSSQRDPVSVYSAVTKCVSKPTEDGAKKEGKSTEPERPALPLKGWNSEKKAGPSILSKRNLSNSQSVFQPAPKREKKNDIPQNDSTKKKRHENESSTRVDKNKDNIEGKTDLSDVQGQQPTSAKPPTDPRPTAPAHQELKPAQNRISSNKVGSQTTTAMGTTDFVSTQTSVSQKSEDTGNKRSASEVWAKALSVSNSERTSKQKASLSIVGGRRSGLPASWSHVSGTRTSSKQPSVISLLRKPSGLAQAKSQMASSGGSVLPSVAQAMSSAHKSNTNTSAVIPMPNMTGLQIQYVPGSEVIGGVRPNGYTVSRQGVVKPVITFNPKSKVPHKLRQTSVEKLFEAWRDNQKLVEGEALAMALRTEQEMYAAANGRVDYRAAVTVKLKDVRK